MAFVGVYLDKAARNAEAVRDLKENSWSFRMPLYHRKLVDLIKLFVAITNI
jgi:hypothetical protein